MPAVWHYPLSLYKHILSAWYRQTKGVDF